jgi:hypothetical protein
VGEFSTWGCLRVLSEENRRDSNIVCYETEERKEGQEIYKGYAHLLNGRLVWMEPYPIDSASIREDSTNEPSKPKPSRIDVTNVVLHRPFRNPDFYFFFFAGNVGHTFN